MKLKLKLALMLMMVVFLIIPSYSFATLVYETTHWVSGTEGYTHNFTADQEPYTYQVTFADLSESPFFGFDFAYLSITSATDTLGSISDFGSFTFDVLLPGETLFANVFGTGGGDFGAGLYGIEISTVPIPTTMLLFGLGLIGLVGVRRKK
ncbi:MAG: hypothetical protein DRH34_04655 [Deltaproteobacteria bacterium]|nr:MAG: hypothetical protein DRH34_04655 [Deltaproteobacteria bacterium]